MAIFFIIMCSYDQVKEQKSDFLTFFPLQLRNNHAEILRVLYG